MKIKSKNTILSLMIFGIIFLILGIPFYNWGFIGDDFGVILHSSVKNWGDFLKFFSGIDAQIVYQPSNYILGINSFLSVFYRPLFFVFFALQNFIWGTNAYGYFLVTIFFHALNSVLLFNFFLYFVSDIWAFWAALFFAFHPSLVSWIGWIAAQHYQINLFFILCLIYFLKKYLDSRKKLFYFLSCFFCLLSVFIKETAIFLPIWLFCAIFFYKTKKDNLAISFVEKIKNVFFLTIPFALISFFYCLLRFCLFPSIKLEAKISQGIISFLCSFFQGRFFDLLTFISDLLGLSFLPQGNRFLKGTLIILLGSVLLWGFIKNTKKKEILFFAFSIFIFMWPAVFRYYTSRYFYEVLPFFILIILFLINFYEYKNLDFGIKCKRLILVFLFFMLLLNVFLLFFFMKQREGVLNNLTVAFDELVNKAEIKNRAICFIGLRGDMLATGIAQAIWSRSVNLNFPIYYDRRTWGFPVDENYLEIKPIKKGFRLSSRDPEKFYIYACGCDNFVMADMQIHKIMNEKVVDVSFLFYKKYLDQNPVFVSWDYKNQRFLILKPPIK